MLRTCKYEGDLKIAISIYNNLPNIHKIEIYKRLRKYNNFLYESTNGIQLSDACFIIKPNGI